MAVITVHENVSLKLFSTMRLGGNARFVCEVTSKADVAEAVRFAKKRQLQCRVIGIGSNIIWQDSGFNGLLIVNKILGQFIHSDGVSITFGAGLLWDDAVDFAVSHSLSGIEFLSLIPGSVGATPVQNVGAYGAEIKDVFTSLEAYDLENEKIVCLSRHECGFAYRSSRFKLTDTGRFIIMNITLKLNTAKPRAPFYESLQAYLDTYNISDYTAAAIRQAVVAIRSSKLPDPAKIANNGSFFANPLITQARFVQLQSTYPQIKGWPLPKGQVKIAAGWLIEQAGFSDFHDKPTGMATWHKQNLVLINEHARTTADLLLFSHKIMAAVQRKFGITLVQEPELLP